MRERNSRHFISSTFEDSHPHLTLTPFSCFMRVNMSSNGSEKEGNMLKWVWKENAERERERDTLTLSSAAVSFRNYKWTSSFQCFITASFFHSYFSLFILFSSSKCPRPTLHSFLILLRFPNLSLLSCLLVWPVHLSSGMEENREAGKKEKRRKRVDQEWRC